MDLLRVPMCLGFPLLGGSKLGTHISLLPGLLGEAVPFHLLHVEKSGFLSARRCPRASILWKSLGKFVLPFDFLVESSSDLCGRFERGKEVEENLTFVVTSTMRM